MSDENPFAGGLQGLMAKATQMQQQVAEAQQRAAKRTVSGEAAGGLVKVTVNGKMEVIEVHLDPMVVDARDIDMLQDLIQAATNAGIEKSRGLIQEELGPLASMLNAAGMQV